MLWVPLVTLGLGRQLDGFGVDVCIFRSLGEGGACESTAPAVSSTSTECSDACAALIDCGGFTYDFERSTCTHHAAPVLQARAAGSPYVRCWTRAGVCHPDLSQFCPTLLGEAVDIEDGHYGVLDGACRQQEVCGDPSVFCTPDGVRHAVDRGHYSTGTRYDQRTGQELCPGPGEVCVDGRRTTIPRGYYGLDGDELGRGISALAPCPNSTVYCDNGVMTPVASGHYATGCRPSESGTACSSQSQCRYANTYCVAGQRLTVPAGFYGVDQHGVATTASSGGKLQTGIAMCEDRSVYCRDGQRRLVEPGYVGIEPVGAEGAGMSDVLQCDASEACEHGMPMKLPPGRYYSGRPYSFSNSQLCDAARYYCTGDGSRRSVESGYFSTGGDPVTGQGATGQAQCASYDEFCSGGIRQPIPFDHVAWGCASYQGQPTAYLRCTSMQPCADRTTHTLCDGTVVQTPPGYFSSGCSRRVGCYGGGSSKVFTRRQECGGPGHYCVSGARLKVQPGWESIGGTETTRTGQRLCGAGFECHGGVAYPQGSYTPPSTTPPPTTTTTIPASAPPAPAPVAHDVCRAIDCPGDCDHPCGWNAALGGCHLGAVTSEPDLALPCRSHAGSTTSTPPATATSTATPRLGGESTGSSQGGSIPALIGLAAALVAVVLAAVLYVRRARNASSVALEARRPAAERPASVADTWGKRRPNSVRRSSAATTDQT